MTKLSINPYIVVFFKNCKGEGSSQSMSAQNYCTRHGKDAHEFSKRPYQSFFLTVNVSPLNFSDFSPFEYSPAIPLNSAVFYVHFNLTNVKAYLTAKVGWNRAWILWPYLKFWFIAAFLATVPELVTANICQKEASIIFIKSFLI